MAYVPVCISYNTGKTQVPGCAITNMLNLWHSQTITDTDGKLL